MTASSPSPASQPPVASNRAPTVTGTRAEMKYPNVWVMPDTSRTIARSAARSTYRVSSIAYTPPCARAPARIHSGYHDGASSSPAPYTNHRLEIPVASAWRKYTLVNTIGTTSAPASPKIWNAEAAIPAWESLAPAISGRSVGSQCTLAYIIPELSPKNTAIAHAPGTRHIDVEADSSRTRCSGPANTG